MSREDILKARGTKYSISPQISWLKEATRSFGLDKVGVTGVCCQMQAVRKAQLYPINMRDVPGQGRLHSRALLHGELPVQVHADHCRGPRGPEPQLREEDGDREGQVLGLHRARERRPPCRSR